MSDVVTYFVFAPFFVIVPYMLAIPRCDRFWAGLDRHDLEVERSGLRFIAIGIAFTLASALLDRVYQPARAAIAAVHDGDYLRALGHGLLWYPPVAMLPAIGIAAILVGLVRVLGIELGPAFDRPELSRSITEWWRRWNIHFRDLLVDLFYYPIVMKHRRRPLRATVLGCIAVFVVGSTLFHWPKQYLRTGSLAALPLGIFVENIVLCIAVAIALVREQRHPDRAPNRLRGLVATWLLVFVANSIAGNGVQAAWNDHVLGTAMPDFLVPRSTDVFPYF